MISQRIIMNKINIIKTYLKLDLFKKRKILSTFFFLIVNLSFAQINVVFDAFPQNAQLIQRNDANQALVDVIGKVYTENYTDVSLIVTKNNKSFYYKKQTISYSQAKIASFAFNPTIYAELSEYNFKLFAFKGKDSILVKEAIEVLCGDNILLYGQSNALANDDSEMLRYNAENKFARTAFADYQKDIYTWLPVFNWNSWSVGLLGLEIQKQLIVKHKIPIGVINGAEGNRNIDELSLRDAANHDNATTIYGRLYRRAKSLGINKSVRIIVWRQGESEALDSNYKNDYDKKFDNLRKQLFEDYPALKKIYTYQNNIYFGQQKYSGTLREYQRTINSKYPDCEVISTVGTETFDGLHYYMEGYIKNGLDASRIIARDFLGAKELNISSPNIQLIFFTAKKDSLILEFDKNQNLTFPADLKSQNTNTPSKNIKDYIYLDGVNGNIESGVGTGNYIILKLKKSSNAKTVSYNPDNYTNDMVSLLPGITQITNANNISALTFKDFPINNDVVLTLSGNIDSSNKKRVVLDWKKELFSNYKYVIEKAQITPTNFYQIGEITGNSFFDYKIKRSINYFYRIKIIDSNNNPIYSNIVEVSSALATELEANILPTNDLSIYPNPVQVGNNLNISTIFDDPIKLINIYDTSGKLIDIIETKNNPYRIETKKLKLGLHLIEAILEDNTKLIKKFVVE